MIRVIGILGTFRVVPREDSYPVLYAQVIDGLLWPFVIAGFCEAANDARYP